MRDLRRDLLLAHPDHGRELRQVQLEAGKEDIMDEAPKHDLATIAKALAIAAIFMVLVLVGLTAVGAEPAKPAAPATTLPVVPVRAEVPNLVPAEHSWVLNGEADGASLAPTTTAPPAPPAPAPVAGCYADLAAQVGWPAEAIPHLTAIIDRESHCDPASDTGYRPSTGDWSLGLLQINTLGYLLEARQEACGIHAREELLDAATNLRCGLALYKVSGFAPWGG